MLRLPSPYQPITLSLIEPDPPFTLDQLATLHRSAMNPLETFHEFFDHCIGTWNTERTYHYLTHQEVERSHTDFVIHRLMAEQKHQVLLDNSYEPMTVEALPGFHLAFNTVSETGETVSQSLNMLFVPKVEESAILTGDYLRDRAYEESRPIISQFRFNAEICELLMTTTYTRVISVDSITLVNPQLRIRRILNYRRPAAGEPMNEVVLVGFGVEQKAA